MTLPLLCLIVESVGIVVLAAALLGWVLIAFAHKQALREAILALRPPNMKPMPERHLKLLGVQLKPHQKDRS